MKKMMKRAVRSCLLVLLCAALCAGLASTGCAADGGGYSYVSFDANGGSGWMSGMSVYDETWTVPVSEFTAPMGKTFKGWGDDPAGPVKYLPGDIAYNDGDTTLYALWRGMSAEELAELYAPQGISINSWNIGSAVDEETGVVYTTAKIGWTKLENVQDFAVLLNLGAPDGPRVPGLGTALSTQDGSVTTSWSTSYGTVAVPFLADGVEQVVTGGAVNGLLDGDVVYATVCGRIGDTLCPGKPVYFTCDKPYTDETPDEVSWFAESGSGTVVRGDYSTTVTLTKDTTLPAGGLSLGSKSCHFVMNSHTLTGTLTTVYGEVFVEHQTGGGTLLALYANGPQTISLNGFGYGSAPSGSASVTFTAGYSQVSYDSSLATVTAANSQVATEYPLTLSNVNDWGYANSQEPVTLEMADLSEAELAQHATKNLAVTPTEDGVILEWDADEKATEAEVSVDVILDDGTVAHISGAYNNTFVAPGEGPSRYAWKYSKGRNIVSMRVRQLGANEEQTVTDGYVEGYKSGQTLRVSVQNVLGGKSGKWQITPASSVNVVHSSGTIGKTFKANMTFESKKYLPVKAKITASTPLIRVYSGQPQTLNYTVETNEGQPLTKDVDYVESYANNVNAGTATLTVTGIGDCSGELTQEFTITGIDVNNNPAVTMQLAYTETTYNGKAQSPAVLMKYGDTILKEGSDYSLTYTNNKEAGTAAVTAVGQGNFAGERTAEYTIAARSMDSENVKATLSGNRFAYTGEAHTPAVAVTWAGTELTKGTDYTLTYVNNTAVGTASAVLTGKGNYANTRNVDFTIYAPVSLALSAGIDPIAPQIYTGSPLTPDVTVRVGDKILTKGWDYTVEYANNTAAGTATVTVTGRRDYTDSATASFAIDPADLAACTMTLSQSEWPYGEAVYTYNGGENKPSATLTFNGVKLYEGTSFTLSYENNIEAGTATAIATGMGNFGGIKTAEFTVSPCDLNDLSTPSVASATYSGKAQTPSISMYTTYLDENRYTQYNYLKEEKDYTVVSWTNNVNAGPVTGYYNGSPSVTPTAAVTVQGKGNFTGTRSIDFAINPMPLYQSDFTVSTVNALTYTGQPVNPIQSVVWKLTGETLAEDRDYTVEYSNYNDVPNNENNDNHTDIGNSIEARLNFTGNFSGSGYYCYFDIVSPSSTVLPVSGNYQGTAWSINEEGTLTVATDGALADLSYHNDVAWRPYRDAIKKIVVSNGVTSLTAGAFSDCPYATEAVLPDGLTAISYSVFTGCGSLKKINIPATVTSLNFSTFPDVPGLEIHLPDNISADSSSGELSFSDNGTKLFVKRGSATEAALNAAWNWYYYEGYPDFLLFRNPSYPEYGLQLDRYTGTGGTVVVPDFIDYVYGSGFSSTYLIEKLVIPGTVSKLGTIQNSYGLREIVIEPGNKLTELPYQFISGCNNITLYIPDNITTISTINYYSDSNMLIVANCDSYAIEWAKAQTSWGIPVWSEEDGTSGPHYRLIHRNPTQHAGKAPTCTEDGWTDYVTCTACNSDTKTVLPALGHSWSAVSYAWNADFTQVTATRTCRRDASHVETETVGVSAAVTEPATCIAEGTRVYTSNVFTNPVFRVQSRTETLPIAGHSWRALPSTAAANGTDGVRGGAVCGVCGQESAPRTVSAQKVMYAPAMLKTIEEEAFVGVAAEQINIPSGTTRIGNRAFANCGHLLLVVIPASVTTIEGNPFAGSDVAVICPDNCPTAQWCDSHGIPHNP